MVKQTNLALPLQAAIRLTAKLSTQLLQQSMLRSLSFAFDVSSNNVQVSQLF